MHAKLHETKRVNKSLGDAQRLVQIGDDVKTFFSYKLQLQVISFRKFLQPLLQTTSSNSQRAIHHVPISAETRR